MGVHFLTVTSHIKLIFLCFVFIINISVSIMFSVSDNNNWDSTSGHPNHQLTIQDKIHLDDSDDFENNLDFEIENIKRTMIQELGFKKVPDVTKMNVSQDEYSRMYDVYLNRLEQRKMAEAEDMENVPKFYTFYQKERHIRRKRRRGITHLVFNISSSEESASVDHSTLRLLAAPSDKSEPVRVQIYQVLNRQKPRLIDERDIFLAAGAPKWCEFDVTNAMRNWIEKDEENLGLEIQCKECKSRGHKLLADHHEKPVINALIKNNRNAREKRSAEQVIFYEKNRRTDCHQKNNKRCCRHKMDFDLTQIGLDFIIQPKTFDGGICKGRCPPYYNAAHNHAVLQSLMRKKNKDLTPRLCCAPSKLQHLDILIADENDPTKLKVEHWANMVVLECACS